MKTTMATAEILLTEWEGASGTDAYRLFHKKSRQTVAKMTAVFYEGMLYWTDHFIGRLYTDQSVAFTDELAVDLEFQAHSAQRIRIST